MSLSVIAVILVALVSAGIAAYFLSQSGADTPAAPPRAWKSDTVTPVIQGARNKAPERVARSFVLGQGALLAMRMAAADGQIRDVERDAVRAFVLEKVTSADDALADKVLRQAEAGLENELEVQRAIEGVVAVSSEEQRALLIELLVHVAQADGVVHPEEIAFLKRIGGMLGLSDAAVEARIALDG